MLYRSHRQVPPTQSSSDQLNERSMTMATERNPFEIYEVAQEVAIDPWAETSGVSAQTWELPIYQVPVDVSAVDVIRDIPVAVGSDFGNLPGLGMDAMGGLPGLPGMSGLPGLPGSGMDG